MKNARALDRIAEYAGLPLGDFVRDRRERNRQALVRKFTGLWDEAMKKQMDAIHLPDEWWQSFELDFSEMQRLLNEAKELVVLIRADTTLIEKMEADSHE